MLNNNYFLINNFFQHIVPIYNLAIINNDFLNMVNSIENQHLRNVQYKILHYFLIHN